MDDVTIEDDIDLDGHVPPSVTQATHQSLLSQLCKCALIPHPRLNFLIEF